MNPHLLTRDTADDYVAGMSRVARLVAQHLAADSPSTGASVADLAPVVDGVDLNLPGYRVIDAVDLPDVGRRVTVASTDPPGCPGCGVIATKVHSRRLQRVRDVPVAGAVEVVWAKRRWFCSEPRCGRGTFAEATGQVPRFARSTGRLKDRVVAAVIVSGRAAAEVARAHQISWWLVQSALTSAAVMLPDVDDVVVTRLGIDEHRYRSVRFFRDQSGARRRYEPWMTTLVDLTTGQVLGVVQGARLDRRGGPAGRAFPCVARAGSGRRDRPLGGVPQGAARAPAPRGDLGGQVPPGQARQ
uniref:Transposase family protein n=1 Tax=Janibacter limosus TaxID=53458 RepID=A0AC61U4R4_9MICO